MDWRKRIEVKMLSKTSLPSYVLSQAISVYRKIEPPQGDNYKRIVKSLIKNNETSFLEHCSIFFNIDGITSVGLRHLVRHRMASYSVESQRYVKRFGDYVIATPDDEKYKDEKALKELNDHILNGYKLYHKLINQHKWKKSYARFAVSNCDCHVAKCSFNFRSLRNFLNLRLDKKSQEEVRCIAKKMLFWGMFMAPEVFEDIQYKFFDRRKNV